MQSPDRGVSVGPCAVPGPFTEIKSRSLVPGQIRLPWAVRVPDNRVPRLAPKVRDAAAIVRRRVQVLAPRPPILGERIAPGFALVRGRQPAVSSRPQVLASSGRASSGLRAAAPREHEEGSPDHDLAQDPLPASTAP